MFNYLGRILICSTIVIMLISIFSFPGKIIHHNVADKYKVYVTLEDGDSVTGYTTFDNYINYFDGKDLVLTNKTIEKDEIKGVYQIYNRYGNKSVNLPIGSDYTMFLKD